VKLNASIEDLRGWRELVSEQFENRKRLQREMINTLSQVRTKIFQAEKSVDSLLYNACRLAAEQARKGRRDSWPMEEQVEQLLRALDLMIASHKTDK